jgi:hypothetical protein
LPNSVKNSIKPFDEVLFSIDSFSSIVHNIVFTYETIWVKIVSSKIA